MPFTATTSGAWREQLFADARLSPESELAFRVGEATSQLRRVYIAGPVMATIHLVYGVVFAVTSATTPAEATWRVGIISAHAAAFAAVCVIVWRARIALRRPVDAGARRRLVMVFVSTYGVFSAAVTGFDLLVVPSITPWILFVMSTATLFPQPARVGAALYGLSALALGAGILLASLQPAAVSSNLLMTLTSALLGWLVSRLIRAANARATWQAETIEAQRAALEAAYGELSRSAHLDALTGIPNRKLLMEQAEALRALCESRGEPLGLVLIDVDHFKSTNDRFGHARGDELLVAIVAACREVLRPSDVIGRQGGDEFLVLVPGCDLEEALAVAERLRAGVEGDAGSGPGGQAATISLGVGAVATSEPEGVTRAIEEADRRLYEAKAAGRNTVRPTSAQVRAGADVRPPVTGAALTGERS